MNKILKAIDKKIISLTISEMHERDSGEIIEADRLLKLIRELKIIRCKVVKLT